MSSKIRKSHDDAVEEKFPAVSENFQALKKFFQALKKFFQALKNYFQALEKKFQASPFFLKIAPCAERPIGDHRGAICEPQDVQTDA